MSKDEALVKELLESQCGDPECDHSNAEVVLLSFLRDEGYNKAADKFEELSGDWWYA